jgi:CBS domain-containing protein
MLLVRDVMTIGVPVCRETETCATVAARLTGEVVVVLDADGMACGWLTAAALTTASPEQLIGEVMEEDIPTVSPTLPAEAAAQLMRERGVEFLFLMHNWPGEPRPSAVISLKTVEERLAGEHL